MVFSNLKALFMKTNWASRAPPCHPNFSDLSGRDPAHDGLAVVAAPAAWERPSPARLIQGHFRLPDVLMFSCFL